MVREWLSHRDSDPLHRTAQRGYPMAADHTNPQHPKPEGEPWQRYPRRAEASSSTASFTSCFRTPTASRPSWPSRRNGHHAKLGMTPIIPSTGSSQVRTSNASVTQPDSQVPVEPPSHDRDVRSCSGSSHPQGKGEAQARTYLCTAVRDDPIARWALGTIAGRPRDLPPPRRVGPESYPALCARRQAVCAMAA
jgi:hypothetical protein